MEKYVLRIIPLLKGNCVEFNNKGDVVRVVEISDTIKMIAATGIFKNNFLK